MREKVLKKGVNKGSNLSELSCPSSKKESTLKKILPLVAYFFLFGEDAWCAGKERTGIYDGVLITMLTIAEKPLSVSSFLTSGSFPITKTHLFKYTEKFSTKNENFQIKKK